ncbi:MAG: peptidoglycan binding domain-containing protein [Clostridiales bacterium]|nr:peptidoglycan binding domain-containing protein [Clostridiales bacterium]
MAGKAQKRSTNSIQAQRRKKHRQQKRRQKMVVIGAILAILAILYLAGVMFFRNHFLPNTVINNIACSGKTVDQSKAAFEEMASEYVLVLTERDDGSEQIKGSEIALDVNPGTSLDEILSEQNPFTWVWSLFSDQEESVEAAVSYDTSLLDTVLSSLNCTDESLMYDSEDASLSEYVSGSGYEMVEEIYGTRLQEDVFLECVDAAILAFEEELNLVESGCYVDPVYTADSEAAQTMLTTANKYVNTTVTYQFGDNTEVLDGSVISQWILVADDLTVTLDEEQETAYIADLASTYDTKWKSRTLVSHSGETVTVPAGGNYGWRVNQDDTLAALNEYLESGEDYTGEVVWYQTAAQYGDQDYGTTYIEVSISAQHFWYYVNGVVVLESDFVSGDVATGHDTPKGAYQIAYKARDQVLEGQGYSHRSVTGCLLWREWVFMMPPGEIRSAGAFI